MIEESVKNARNGVDMATEVAKVLEEISESVSKASDLVSEIAAASQEQAQGIDQINTAVTQMDKVTQQNAANSEESASAAEELSAQADALRVLVQQFTLSRTAHRSVTSSGASVAERGGVSSGVAGRRSVPANRRLGKSDRVFHEIAERGESKRSSSVALKGSAEKRRRRSYH